MADARQRRALGALFLVLALVFGGIAYAAVTGGAWPIGAAAIVLALWIGSLGARALLMRRRG